MSDTTPLARSMFQFSVALIVIGVAAAFLFDALHDVQEQTERTVMEATVRNMDSGLMQEMAARIMRGQESSIADLVGKNPVQWLEKPPAGYSGRCMQELVPGAWCFDEGTAEIVYRPLVERHLRYLEAGRPGLRWKVRSAADMSGRPRNASFPVGAIKVVSTTSFVWR